MEFYCGNGIDMTFNANLRFKFALTSEKSEIKSSATEAQFGTYCRAATLQG